MIAPSQDRLNYIATGVNAVRSAVAEKESAHALAPTVRQLQDSAIALFAAMIAVYRVGEPLEDEDEDEDE